MATDATQLADWQKFLDSYGASLGGWHQNQYDRIPGLQRIVGGDVDKFTSQFTNLVGRAPTTEETNTFVQQFIVPNAGDLGNGGSALSQNIGDNIKGFIGDTFQQQAKDVASQQLQGQQGEANRLADMFRSQGTSAINDTEQHLLDYQSKLFERLRPNLITSLQAQGLLNTGGLNQAVAGAQGDLANAASGSLMDARLNNENQANAIAFGGASAPYQFQQGQILNQVPYLQNQGQNAMNNNFQTFMQNLQFQNQMGLQNNSARLQAGNQGGFFKNMGQSLATSMGSSLGKWFDPSTFSSGQGGTSAGAGIAQMLSSRQAKKDITKLSTKEEDALYEELVNMPLNRWRYKTEDGVSPRHLGTMTDEALPEMVTADGEHLSIVDYLGVITLALKVQHRRMQREVA